MPPSVHLGRIDYGQPGLTPASAHSLGSLGAKGTRQRSEESKSHILPSPNRNSITPANSLGACYPGQNSLAGANGSLMAAGSFCGSAHSIRNWRDRISPSDRLSIPRKIILGLWVLRLGSQAGCAPRPELYSGPYAQQSALRHCGSNCKVVVRFTNACGALAVGAGRGYGPAAYPGEPGGIYPPRLRHCPGWR